MNFVFPHDVTFSPIHFFLSDDPPIRGDQAPRGRDPFRAVRGLPLSHDALLRHRRVHNDLLKAKASAGEGENYNFLFPKWMFFYLIYIGGCVPEQPLHAVRLPG